MTASDTRRTLRRAATSKVVLAQTVLGLLTVIAAALSCWAVAVAGIVLMLLVLTLVGARTAPAAPAAAPSNAARASSAPSADRLDELEERVDALGARLVAGTERTRVELLDALREGRRTDGGGPTA